MKLVYLGWQVAADTYMRPAFACDEGGCQRHYDIIHGYYTISGGRIDPASKTRQLCREDELPMFLYEYEPQNKRETWMCAQFGCGADEVTCEAISGRAV
jgi:hypothetical protein